MTMTKGQSFYGGFGKRDSQAPIELGILIRRLRRCAAAMAIKELSLDDDPALHGDSALRDCLP